MKAELRTYEDRRVVQGLLAGTLNLLQYQPRGSIYKGIQDQINLDNKTFTSCMDGKSYPIVNASVDANNSVMSRAGHRFLHHQDNVNLVPLVKNITKWTGSDSMQLLVMRCASLNLGNRNIKDFGLRTLEGSHVIRDDTPEIDWAKIDRLQDQVRRLLDFRVKCVPHRVSLERC
jgi:hypothetical protein